MTDAELRAFVEHPRADVDAQLAQLDALDRLPLPPTERLGVEEHRRALIELRASIADEAICCELEATEYTGRDLTPDGVEAAIV